MNIKKKLASIALVVACMTASPVVALEVVEQRYTDLASLTGKTFPASKIVSAFKQCSLSRGWKFDTNGSGRMIGQLFVRGKHYVAVDVAYNSKSYTISYRDSKNMKYNPETKKIHKRYNSWVTNLDNDVQFCLR